MSSMATAQLGDDVGKLVLRLIVGALVGLHGLNKLLHGIAPIEGMVQAAGLPAFTAYGVYVGEVLGPVLVIAGLYGRIGAALIAVNMVVAIALVHRPELAMLNQHGGWMLELQGMYLFGALALVFLGPGRLSVDGR